MARYEYSDTELFLLRRALSRGTKSATLMQQARAIEQLLEMGTPVPVDRIREELEAIRDNDLSTYQSGQAASKAQRVLAIIDGQAVSDAPATPWGHPDVPDRQRLDMLRVHLGQELALTFRWRVDPDEWRAGSDRLCWIDEQQSMILSSPDPLQAADEWLRDPPPLPAKLDGGPVLVATLDDAEPYGDPE